MRKLKIGSILLLIVSVVIFGAYKIYEYKTADNTPPSIICPVTDIITSTSITEEELLDGVIAIDEVSGDVTGTLVIEEISAFVDEDTRIITYAAIDEKGNVGRLQRTLTYTDYERPKFSLSEPLRVQKGRTIELMSIVSAQSVLDGDLTDKIKYSLETTIDTTTPGTYPIEFRVTDSCGIVEYLPVEVQVYDATEEIIEVELTDYLIYLPLNAEFDANDYYAGADREGTLTVQSNLDTGTAGVYHVDYIVTGSNGTGKNRLVVVVKES